MLVTLNQMKTYLGIGGITYPAVTVDLDIDTVAGTITRASGSWTIDNVVAGSLLTLAGFSNPENNVEVAVQEVVSATVIKYLGPIDMIDETGSGTSFDQADPANDTTYDSFLTDQITLISDAIEEYCNRKFSEVSYIQTWYRDDFEFKNPTELYLYQYPVSSVTAIEVDGVAVDADEYRLSKNIGRIKLLNTFPYEWDEIVVDYTAGYATVPPLITNVVYQLVQERYNKKVSGVDLNFGSDVQRVSIPGTISIDYDYTLSNNDRATPFGSILGSTLNILDSFRSERVFTHIAEVQNNEEV